jgi:hypothetical protein
MTLDLNTRQLSLILASLRFIQDSGEDYDFVFYDYLKDDPHSVTNLELDDLCEYISNEF